jgi:hypothetical protein
LLPIIAVNKRSTSKELFPSKKHWYNLGKTQVRIFLDKVFNFNFDLVGQKGATIID